MGLVNNPVSISSLGAFGIGPGPVARLLRVAGRLPSLKAVMGSTPTLTTNSVNTSTVNASYSFTSPMFPASAGGKVGMLGGPPSSAGLSAYAFRPRGVTTAATTGGGDANREAIHAGPTFCTYASKVGICANFRTNGDPSAQWMVYVTDLLTGISSRARITTADQATGGNTNIEYIIDFGSRALRRLDVYASVTAPYYSGINVPAGEQVWVPTDSDDLRLAVLGDSWGSYAAAAADGGTNPAKLGPSDFYAQAMGCANPLISSIGGTGILAPGTHLKFRDRLLCGDLDYTRVGVMDAVKSYVSLNDITNGFTPAAVRTEIALLLATIRTAQPSALILFSGTQVTPGVLTYLAANTTYTLANWFTAAAGGVSDYIAASGDRNVIYVEVGPTGANILNAGVNTALFTGTNHLNDVGIPYWGQFTASADIAAVRAWYGL